MRLVLLGIFGAMLLAMLDNRIAGTAMPTIVSARGARPTWCGWSPATPWPPPSGAATRTRPVPADGNVVEIGRRRHRELISSALGRLGGVLGEDPVEQCGELCPFVGVEAG